MSHGKVKRDPVMVSLNDITRQVLHIVSGCLHCCVLQELHIVSDSFSVTYPAGAGLVYRQ